MEMNKMENNGIDLESKLGFKKKTLLSSYKCSSFRFSYYPDWTLAFLKSQFYKDKEKKMKFLFQLPPGSYLSVIRSQKKSCQGIWPAQFLPISGVKKKFLACKIIIYTDNTKVQEG